MEIVKFEKGMETEDAWRWLDALIVAHGYKLTSVNFEFHGSMVKGVAVVVLGE